MFSCKNHTKKNFGFFFLDRIHHVLILGNICVSFPSEGSDLQRRWWVGLRATMFDLLMRIQIERSAALDSGKILLNEHSNFKQKTKQHLLGWGQDFGGKFPEDKSLNPTKRQGLWLVILLCLIRFCDDTSHPRQASTVTLNYTPRPVLISQWRDAFEQVDAMASINYASHCCDKYPGQTQLKEDRVRFSSQFRIEFSLMRTSWQQEPRQLLHCISSQEAENGEC